MKGFVLNVVVTAIAVWVAIQVVPDYLTYDGEPVGLLGLALLFGVVNGFVKPIVQVLSLPIRMATLGLFGFVISVAAFLLVAFLANVIDIDFLVGGFPPDFGVDAIVGAVIGGIVMSIVSTLIGFFVPD